MQQEFGQTPALAVLCGAQAFKLNKIKRELFSSHSTKCVHSLLVNKVTCRENKVGEKGGKGFGCPSKKEEECMLLFGGGQQAWQT